VLITRSPRLTFARIGLSCGSKASSVIVSVVISALDRGLSSTVAQDATATRDLPDPTGGVLPADTVHRAALAAIADRFATVVPAADIPD
jgi:hypothetical protein